MSEASLRRIVAIDLPTFTADLARIRWRRRLGAISPPGNPDDPGDPVVLVFEERHGRRVVTDCCSRARDRGVHPGMALAEATALGHDVREDAASSRRPGHAAQTRRAGHAGDGPRTIGVEPIVVPAAPPRARKALTRLAVSCLRFAPIAAVDGGNGILLDIRGCSRWLASQGGESGLLDRIEATFRRAGFAVRTAIADTVVAARAWAAWRPAAPPSTRHDHRRLPGEAIWAALDPLPVECLELDADVVDRLHQVNVRCVGDLRRLPRTALPARYGPALHRRLDQVIGRGGDAFTEARVVPVRAADRVLASRTFAGPVRSRDAIELAVVDLVGDLHDRLQAIASGARILRIVADRVDAPDWIDQVELARATRRPAHLWSVLEPLVERLPLDHGIDTLVLEAARHRRLRDRSAPIVPGAVDGGEDPHLEESFAAFVDLVQARFGDDSMRRFHPAPGHAPEDRMRLRPLDRGDPGEPATDDRRVNEIRTAIRRAMLASGPRPTTWLDRPEPIEVDIERDIERGIDVGIEAADARPTALHWRGRRRVVEVATGPESIGAPWWRRPIDLDVEHPGHDGRATDPGEASSPRPEAIPRRDYWSVRLDDGVAIWIFRASSSDRWFVQGVWA